MKGVKRSIIFPVLLVAGLSIQGALACEEWEKEAITPEEHAPQSISCHASPFKYWLDVLPSELQLKVLSFLPKGGHKSIQAYITSEPGQRPLFDKTREAYQELTECNLHCSIPPDEIVKYTLNRPTSFTFYDGFMEERLAWPYTGGSSMGKGCVAKENDIISLGRFLLALGRIDSIWFIHSNTSVGYSGIVRLLEILKEKESLALRFSADLDTDSNAREVYERHFLTNIWPIIKQMPLLLSLDIDMENEGILNFMIREATDLDLPLKSLAIGYISLKGRLSDGVALLVANSSFLKTLVVHDIETDLANLKPIITSVKRNTSFEKFIVDVRGDSNNVPEEDVKKFEELVRGNDKFDFEYLL